MHRPLRYFAVAFSLLALRVCAAPTDDVYKLGPDSEPHPGVPQGKVSEWAQLPSAAYPGTLHDYCVYVPAQYSPATPACLWVNQDGVQNNAPAVFDQLIAKKEIPVLIGVFATPGIVKAATPATALDRFNRSVEYDTPSDAFVRFLTEELLPFVETKQTADGRAIHLSKNANDRAIAGQSSGGICAFNAAWERPAEFSRVLSVIGSLVPMRGGDVYSGLVRITEPKAIRVFLQDNAGDQNIYSGDWFMGNQTLERALTYAHYEVNHAWGEGGHSGGPAVPIFPDMVRWLWHDWPQPVKAGRLPLERIGPVLIDGEDWQLVGDGFKSTEGPAADARGEVSFCDMGGNKTFHVGADGKISVVLADSKRVTGQAYGPDGRLYVSAATAEKILAYDSTGKESVIAEGFVGNDLVVAHNGNVYATNPPANNANDPSKVWLIRPDGTKQVVDTGIRYANGVTLSPDQSLLYVDDYRSHWVYSFVIQPDGTLAHKQRFYHLKEPVSADQSNADGLKVDRDGRLYVATNMGVQVCDQAGRVNLIIPTPNRKISNLCFGGEKFDTLYATCGDKVYKRKLNATGANAWAEPNKPAPPRL